MKTSKYLNKDFYIIDENTNEIEEIFVAAIDENEVYYYVNSGRSDVYMTSISCDKLFKTEIQARNSFPDVYLYSIENHFPDGKIGRYDYFSKEILNVGDYVRCSENKFIGIVKGHKKTKNYYDFLQEQKYSRRSYKEVRKITKENFDKEKLYNIEMIKQQYE